MENRRRFSRFSNKLKAQYFLSESPTNRKECTVVNISRDGMGLELHTQEKIEVGSIIHLEILIIGEFETILFKGKLIWQTRKGNNFIGGIKLEKMLDEITFAKLG